MIWLAPLWFGFWRRFYGTNKSWFPNDENRIIGYALPLALSTFLIYSCQGILIYQLLHFFLLGAAFWTGISLVKYSKYWNITSIKDWFFMALNGLLITFLPGIIIGVIQSSFWLGLTCGMSGILIAPGYWLGWKLPTLNKNFLNQGTEWGEVLGHALIGFVFVGVHVWSKNK